MTMTRPRGAAAMEHLTNSFQSLTISTCHQPNPVRENCVFNARQNSVFNLSCASLGWNLEMADRESEMAMILSYALTRTRAAAAARQCQRRARGMSRPPARGTWQSERRSARTHAARECGVVRVVAPQAQPPRDCLGHRIWTACPEIGQLLIE